MKAKGFTLIELAIVIVIIGILVAIAVPRFVDLTGQANQANVEATAASVRSAYAIATVQAKGVPTCAQILGNLDGGTVSGTTWTSADGNTTVSCTSGTPGTITVTRGTASVTLRYNIN
ncbi:prepilin-type N-terminal cleavage/methylation domain-containing protein [Thermus sp. PS18]|uniref:prepilin-type N-terminal cleavage/methylation domain-containing protein n=1 Tax=Thermus sp. PS18 TaxID=2849039 RepID=UPI002265630D|nr:prepilin-type N-terminal cleavage/methylation domain-containing protein [Thermus sp. PS18]UZX15748.1 prepilin-type N-terminal cleavage/methylation domain-containing protein [Thermus sp. PS18]